MSPAGRAADPHRAQLLKRAVFALLLLGVLGGTLLGLRLLGQGFARVTRVQEQASGLHLSRRPEATPPLRWRPDAAALDGVTREDIRAAYLLAHAELTYARRSGDLSGLPGLFAGEALRAAQAAGPGLLLDWDHRAQVLSAQLQPVPPVPGSAAGGPPDGGQVSLRDDYWAATARPGPAGWLDVQVTRRRVEAQLRQTDGRWRITALRPLAQVRPQPGPVSELSGSRLGLSAWRALTLPADWVRWSPATWRRRLAQVARAGLGPLRAPLPARPTRAELQALGAALAEARAAGVGLVPAFDTPLRLEELPLRAQVAARLPPTTLAFDPGAIDPADPGSRAALLALRLSAPDIPVVAALSGDPPEAQPPSALGRRLGLSATVTADANRAATDPGTLLILPGAARTPWGRGAADAALDAAAAQGRWLGRLDDLLGPDGDPSERGRRVLRRAKRP